MSLYLKWVSCRQHVYRSWFSSNLTIIMLNGKFGLMLSNKNKMWARDTSHICNLKKNSGYTENGWILFQYSIIFPSICEMLPFKHVINGNIY